MLVLISYNIINKLGQSSKMTLMELFPGKQVLLCLCRLKQEIMYALSLALKNGSPPRRSCSVEHASKLWGRILAYKQNIEIQKHKKEVTYEVFIFFVEGYGGGNTDNLHLSTIKVW